MVSFPDSVWDGDSGSRDSVSAAPTWQRMLAEIQAMQSKTIADEHEGVTYPGLVGSETGNAALRRTTFVFTNMEIAITDAGANGAHGTVKLYTFTDGHADIFVGSISGTVERPLGVGGIASNAVLDIAIGSTTVSVSDETLSGTEQNITTKADVTLSGGSKVFEATNVTAIDMDGELSIYLNIAIEDASVTSDGSLTLTGQASITWNNHHV